MAALAPADRHDGDIHAGLGKSGKLAVGAALTLRQGGTAVGTTVGHLAG
ncbi:MAG: hypothetical protein ACLVJ8_02555 [Ruthenibacterium lactatiformans]